MMARGTGSTLAATSSARSRPVPEQGARWLRIGQVDVPAKTEGDNSNAVAGYYISTTGAVAPGRVASTSDITAMPNPSNLPTPSQMPQQAPITPSPGNLPPPPGYR